MKKKKILIVFADAGNGHRSASDALIKAVHKHHRDNFSVKAIDIFKIADISPYNTSDATHKLVSSNRSIESIYNFIFTLVNTDIGSSVWDWLIITRLYERCSEIIANESPDIVITVHPMVNIILAEIKKREQNFKLHTVITDLVSLARGWINNNSDLIFAPTLEAIDICAKVVDRNKIAGPLFPLNPTLANYRKSSSVLTELKFRTARPVLLVTGGGVGSTKLEKVVAELYKLRKYNLIVICGRLDSLREQLAEQYKRSGSVRILGFVDNMQDYLNVCEVMIGKPGPATILELELFNKKGVLTKPIGKQEWGNIDYALQTENFIYIKDDYDGIASSVESLLARKVPENPHQRKFDEASMIVERILAD